MDLLHQILQYLSHLVLSDLVASGMKEGELYYYIQNILSRPTEGQYVGFLRETARHQKKTKYSTAVPELLEFIYNSEIGLSLTKEEQPLLGTLVDFRNLFAHGNLNDKDTINRNFESVAVLTIQLLESLIFLEKYVLSTEEGYVLMGSESIDKGLGSKKLIVSIEEAISLRPLILKMKGHNLLLLEDFDLKEHKILFRGADSYFTADKRDIAKPGDGNLLFTELKELLQKVRDESALLPEADWAIFTERSASISQNTISSYKETGKFEEELYLTREEWTEGGIYDQFLASEKTILSISGEQGSGKSSLLSHLAIRSLHDGNPTLFINGQRFSYADVNWSSNPYSAYFSKLLNIQRGLDSAMIKKLIKQGKKEASGKKIIIIIDAIDEIDGVEVKWNRYRALSFLLDWISNIAQPGLQIILGFDLKPYQEFEYLIEDKVPENINEISYTENSETDPITKWCIALSKLKESQARSIFEYYQRNSEKGYAPDLSWEDLSYKLGKEFDQVYGNPLLLKWILRALNGKNIPGSANIDGIILLYLNEYTGADKISNSSWLKRFTGFLKNGNITPTEQFLYNLISYISSKGAPSFLVNELDSKTKKEKRLKESIDNPDKNKPFKELKEAGIIQEEIIDISSQNKTFFSRRLCFTESIIAESLNTIRKKVERMNKSRVSLFLFLTFLLVIPMLATYVGFELVGERLVYGKEEFPIIFKHYLIGSLPILISMITIGLGYSISMLFSLKVDSPAIAKDNLQKVAFINHFNSNLTKSASKYAVIGFLVIVFALILVSGNKVFQNALLLLAMLLLIGFVLFKRSIDRYLLAGANSRMIKYAFEFHYHHYTQDLLRKKQLQLFIFSLLSILIIFTAGIIAINLIKPFSNQPIAFTLTSMENLQRLTVYSLTVFGYIPTITLIISGFSALTIAGNAIVVSGLLSIKQSRYFKSHPIIKSASLKGWLRYSIITSIIVLVGAFSIDYIQNRSATNNIDYMFEEGDLPDFLIEKDELDPKDLRFIYRNYKGVHNLDLSPLQGKAKFQLGKLKNISNLTIHGEDIQDTRNISIHQLTLLEPGSALCDFTYETVGLLILIDSPDCFSDIKTHFPNLVTLITTEAVMKESASSFSNPTPNLSLNISRDNISAPLDSTDNKAKKTIVSNIGLDWLTNEHAKCILTFNWDISNKSQNLDKIRRLDYGKIKNEDQNILIELRDIEWLQIGFDRDYSYNPELWTTLIDCVENKYTRLKTLSIGSRDYTTKIEIMRILNGLHEKALEEKEMLP